MEFGLPGESYSKQKKQSAPRGLQMGVLGDWRYVGLEGAGDLAYVAAEGSEHFITAGSDGFVFLFEADSLEKAGDDPVGNHDEGVRALAVARDGSCFATGGEDKHVRLFSYPSKEPIGGGIVSRFVLPVRLVFEQLQCKTQKPRQQSAAAAPLLRR